MNIMHFTQSFIQTIIFVIGFLSCSTFLYITAGFIINAKPIKNKEISIKKLKKLIALSILCVILVIGSYKTEIFLANCFANTPVEVVLNVVNFAIV